MKVSELIEQLSKQNQDHEVYIDTDGAEFAKADVVSIKELSRREGKGYAKFEAVFITSN